MKDCHGYIHSCCYQSLPTTRVEAGGTLVLKAGEPIRDCSMYSVCARRTTRGAAAGYQKGTVGMKEQLQEGCFLHSSAHRFFLPYLAHSCLPDSAPIQP